MFFTMKLTTLFSSAIFAASIFASPISKLEAGGRLQLLSRSGNNSARSIEARDGTLASLNWAGAMLYPDEGQTFRTVLGSM